VTYDLLPLEAIETIVRLAHDKPRPLAMVRS